MPRKWILSPEERADRAIEDMSRGSLRGRLKSASPYRFQRAGALGSTASTGHDHMGTGADSTIVSGLRDSTPADASGAQSFAGGDAAVASGASSVAIGDSSSATGSASIAILANSTSDGAINILGSSVGVDSVSIGNAASSIDDGVAIGPGALASVDAVGIGHSTIANSSQSIALGPANALEDDAVAISGTVHVGATKGIALGRSSDVAAATAMALGANSSASGIASTAIGYLAATSADNQIMLGTSAEEVYFPGTAPLWIPQGASAGYVLTSDAAGHGTWQAGGGGGGSSPLTTKGDVWGYSTVDARIPIGTDGYVLTADSTQTLGLKWAAAGSGAVATDTIWDAKGDLAVGTGADTAAKLTVGANGTMIVADSTQSTGLKWFTPSYADVYRNSAQNLTSGGFTQVNYDTVSNQSADNPWDNTNHNFKCPIAGRYLITAVVGFNPAVALTSTAALSLYVNGSEQKRGLQVQTGTWSSFVSSFQYTAAANDTLDIRVFHAQGVNVPVATGAGTIHAEFAYIGPT